MKPDTTTSVAALVARADQVLRKSEALLEESRAPMRVASRTLVAGDISTPAYRAVSVQSCCANPKLAPQRSVAANNGRNRYEPVGPYCVSTYASIAATCPGSCPFRDNGCFAQAGASHLTMGKLDRSGRKVRPLSVTLAEADKIAHLWQRDGVPQDGARGGRDLRLHVGGDVSCADGAAALAEAAQGYQERGGGAVWTYTHRWRELGRSSWGAINVFASCESPADVRLAWRRGYEAAVTVDDFRGRSAYPLAPGITAIPCPFEARGRVTCVQCRLCLDPRPLRSRQRVIAFAAHGKDADRARVQLRIIDEESRL